jgi:orotate phosphoribosyltransferase
MDEEKVSVAEKRVLALVESGKVMTLDPGYFADRLMTNNEMVAIFKAFDAFWQYEGSPEASKPHALLKSGLHSNGFIMSKTVLEYPSLCMIFAHEMLKVVEYRVHHDNLRRIGFVACSAYSAINLGFCLAFILGQKYDIPVRHVIVEKDKDGNPTIIRGGIDSESIGLVINELMTTGKGSTWETRQAVLKSNGDNPSPKVKEPAFVLIHRSKDLILPDLTKVAWVFHFDIENFTPEECPYCKAGSKAIKPKVGDNWKLLHGEG